MLQENTPTQGLKIDRFFTEKNKDVFSYYDYDLRTSIIKDPSGKTIFEQNNVEVPSGWSQTATDILAQKYFRKTGVPVGDGKLCFSKEGCETSVKQVTNRLASCWQKWGEEYGYFNSKEDSETFYNEIMFMLLGQYAAPNSPQWFNTGLFSEYGIAGTPQGHYFVNPRTGQLEKSTSAYERPQPHACFILSVEDDLVNDGGIMDLWVREARIFKYGSGVGTNFSKIRGSGENLSGGGSSSGLMSFLKIGDRAAAAIKSGGTCFPAYTKVYTSNGVESAESLAQKCDSDPNFKFVVFSYDPIKQDVKPKYAKAWKAGNKKIVRIYTEGGYFDLSHDHPVLLAGTHVNVKASELKQGQRLLSTFTMDKKFRVDKENREIYIKSHAIDGYISIEKLIANPQYAAQQYPSYQDIYVEVLRVEELSNMDVYDIEVECPTLDDKSANSGHNFLIFYNHSTDDFIGGGIYISNTRRAAKMVCLDLDHPEVVEFINWKKDEEKKVAALIAHGYDNGYEGEAYATVSGQNSNNSIRVPNEFFEALKNDEDWQLKARTDGRVMQSIKASELWKLINEAAWACADPALQFDTTINEWHTCPKGGRINASNPCSEYMFLDNTACNLASLNLHKFYDEEKKELDFKGIIHATRLWTIVLEISVLMAQFPSPEVAQLSYDYRTLGLGYANLGAVLMIMGIPYDSAEATALCGAITAIMTGHSYATSADMARVLGTFSKYEENKENMLRVIENHMFAAQGLAHKCKGLSIAPKGINHSLISDKLSYEATYAWEYALSLGREHGYRNAQTTVIAPTGTIGLLMDCDTTGIEPDFSLVKYKKLSGGGYFKIVNQAVGLALKNLGYNENSIREIEQYIIGHGTLKGCSTINTQTLIREGLTQDDIDKVEKNLKDAFKVEFVFNYHILGEDTLKRLGFKENQYKAEDFNLLKELGYSSHEITVANLYVCGNMMIEGAPNLKEEHLPIFDTANRNGNYGKRFLSAQSHIRMMAAAQPFISGAISKTINLPNEATVEDIAECYLSSWVLGLKSNALYRDGCKLSQPLSSKSDEKVEVEEEKALVSADIIDEKVEKLIEDLTPEQVIEAALKIINASTDTIFKRKLSTIVHKKRLPNKRGGFTQKVKISGQTVFVRTGNYEDGTLGEIFIDMHKEGTTVRSIMNCFAIAVSIGLQYGVPLEDYVEKFAFTRFEPSGLIQGHDNIKNCNSIVDFIFRLLGFEYLNDHDLVQIKPTVELLARGDGDVDTDKPLVSKESLEENMYSLLELEANTGINQMDRHLKQQQSDAPLCNVCFHTTVRSGVCYKCLNCGNSLGCS